MLSKLKDVLIKEIEESFIFKEKLSIKKNNIEHNNISKLYIFLWYQIILINYRVLILLIKYIIKFNKFGSYRIIIRIILKKKIVVSCKYKITVNL